METLCVDCPIDTQIVFCNSCARPLLQSDATTHQYDKTINVLNILNNTKGSQHSAIHREQHRIFVTNDRVYVCHICHSAWKKMHLQLETSAGIDQPAQFMEDTYQHCLDGSFATDKLSLMKGLVCSMTTVSRTDGSRIYHPLRHRDREVLEASIVFLRFVLDKTGMDFRTFSRDASMCPFEIVAIARSALFCWLHATFRLCFPDGAISLAVETSIPV